MQKPFDISDALLRELHDSETRSAAFGRLLESCLTPLYWHARRLVVVHEDAEDVVQAVSYTHLTLPTKLEV